VRTLLLALVLLLLPLAAGAQEEVRLDPETGERYRLERPPEGPARGRWRVASWVVWTGGGLVFAGALAGLLRRLRHKH